MAAGSNRLYMSGWFGNGVIVLHESKLAINNDMLETASNRIYYSIFYTVMALGYCEGFTTSKHSELRGWFNKNYMKTVP